MIEALTEQVQRLLETLPVDQIQSIVKEFTIWTKENPVVGGVIGIWLLGVVSYWLKHVPSQIMSLVHRYLTVSVTIDNEDKAYFNAMAWFGTKGYATKARTLRANNGRYGNEDTIVLSPGYGSFTFFFRGWPYRMHKQKEESKDSNKIRESITIRTISYGQKRLRRLIEEFNVEPVGSDKTTIMAWKYNDWTWLAEQPGRGMETVVADQAVKTRLVNAIRLFEDRQDWYQNCGIPYRLGIALHGVPGTGKTSMVMALCHLFNKKLHIISLAGMTDKALQDALAELDNRSVVLIEDIDTFTVTKDRESDDTAHEGGPLTLSGLLNAIDGAVASHGRILIMTTNHLDHLDEALRRPGRCDIVVEMGYLTDETAREMFNRFWPDFTVPESWELKDEVTPAMFQGLALQNLSNPLKVVEYLSR